MYGELLGDVETVDDAAEEAAAACLKGRTLADEIAALRCQLDRWFVRYANPEIDGSREPVRGGGQAGLAGTWGNGNNIYPVNDHC